MIFRVSRQCRRKSTTREKAASCASADLATAAVKIALPVMRCRFIKHRRDIFAQKGSRYSAEHDAAFCSEQPTASLLLSISQRRGGGEEQDTRYQIETPITRCRLRLTELARSPLGGSGTHSLSSHCSVTHAHLHAHIRTHARTHTHTHTHAPTCAVLLGFNRPQPPHRYAQLHRPAAAPTWPSGLSSQPSQARAALHLWLRNTHTHTQTGTLPAQVPLLAHAPVNFRPPLPTP